MVYLVESFFGLSEKDFKNLDWGLIDSKDGFHIKFDVSDVGFKTMS